MILILCVENSTYGVIVSLSAVHVCHLRFCPRFNFLWTCFTHACRRM